MKAASRLGKLVYRSLAGLLSRPLAPKVVSFALLLLFALASRVAQARVGGGQGYSGGGGGSSGSSGGGGDSIADFFFELIFQVLLDLCIEEPSVGIPLIIFAIAIWLTLRYLNRKRKEWTSSSQVEGSSSPRAGGQKSGEGKAA